MLAEKPEVVQFERVSVLHGLVLKKLTNQVSPGARLLMDNSEDMAATCIGS